MRRLVMLQRVVRQVLLPLGEHDAVDLGQGVLASEGDVLVDFRQPAAEGADGPLQPRIAIDERLLMGEVPDAASPSSAN